MLNVQIGQTLAGISLIVGSVGTLRWIGGARLSFHDSSQRCSVHDSTVRVGRVRTVKSRFGKSSLSKMTSSIELNVEFC